MCEHSRQAPEKTSNATAKKHISVSNGVKLAPEPESDLEITLTQCSAWKHIP